MSVTRTFAAGADRFYQQIEAIIKSHSLRGSESLCKLLQYLAKQALDHPDAPIKEYQIATEVYGRSPDFDPQSDSTIRVQAGRLRVKLAEYYASEGAADAIVVKIPKGSYHLIFEPRAGEAPALEAVPPRQALAHGVAETVPPMWRVVLAVLSIGLLSALIALGVLLWGRKSASASSSGAISGSTSGATSGTNFGTTSASASSPQNAGPLAAFWRPFLAGTEAPWVIFSNAAFVGRPETGMRYFTAHRDSKNAVYDHYTGVGEVLAIHALDDAFATLGRKILVKRGSLFTLDDVKSNNLIFVGSPSENLSLQDIPNTQEFVFQRVTTGPRQGDLSIVSKRPAAGEAAVYLASPSNQSLTEDYAVVGLVPGFGGRNVMILAGTTTFGTQGAVEFACHPESVEKLLEALGASGGSAAAARPFEALVRVKIARGVPVESELIAVRAR